MAQANTPAQQAQAQARYSAVLRAQQYQARAAQNAKAARAGQQQRTAQKGFLQNQQRQKQATAKGASLYTPPRTPEPRATTQPSGPLPNQLSSRTSSPQERQRSSQNDQQNNIALQMAMAQQAALQQQRMQDQEDTLNEQEQDNTQRSPAQQEQLKKQLIGKQTSVALYGSLFSFSDFGASLIPLNLWMFGFLTKFVGPFQGPPFFPHKVSGWLVVGVFNIGYGAFYALIILQIMIYIYIITNPTAALELGFGLLKELIGF